MFLLHNLKIYDPILIKLAIRPSIFPLSLFFAHFASLFARRRRKTHKNFFKRRKYSRYKINLGIFCIFYAITLRVKKKSELI